MGKRHGKALEQSKKGTFAVEFDSNKRVSQVEFQHGQVRDSVHMPCANEYRDN